MQSIQAISRLWRVGQRKIVHVVKLLVPHTIETRISALQKSKEKLQEEFDKKLRSNSSSLQYKDTWRELATKRDQHLIMRQLLTDVIVLHDDDGTDRPEENVVSLETQISGLHWEWSK